MEYQDKIYGKVEINEPVILDLINSPSMQRIKGVDQAGHFEVYCPHEKVTRFEHCVGVFILLKKFGAPLLEQISGLLHDVSHTAFSHVADYVFNDGSGRYKNFQDEELPKFIENSEIPEILKKHGINYKDILDESKFLLQERELPDLCADRIDYFLRDGFAFKKVTKPEAGKFLNSLAVKDNKWVFKDKDLAKRFAHLYLEVNDIYWSSLQSAAMFINMAELIKYSLEKGVISHGDLFKTDKDVWEKIRPAAKNDEKLKFLIDRADNKYNYESRDKNDYDLFAFNKSRMVDPLYIEGGKLKRVSGFDQKIAKISKTPSFPKEYYIKFLELRK